MLMAYPTMWLVIIFTTAAAVQVELGTSNYHMANATPSQVAVPVPLLSNVTVGGGSYTSEVSWTLSCDDGTSVAGGAPYDQTISVSPGASCQLAMGDSWGDGWNGNYWEGLGQSFTLPSGSAGSASFTVSGATPGPTPATTSSPTPSPTSSPTAGNSISASGDPHMTSVTGAKFDILRSGNHTLLHIPQHSHQKVALVIVRAFVKHEGSTCLDMYIESLHITGKWAEERQRGGYSFYANQTSGVRKSWLSLGKLDFKVVYGTTVSGVRYLNLFARHLAKLGMPIGGILGLDGHESAATPEAGCQRRVSL